ncbi:phosphoglucomutase/phosphomannomutase family protein [Hydrogenoanaerobacterium sp.]|uniref:phosphoglucomutase/phosphomannomutase family protein n=1 Tax=Hydrogenoanaerobacterium sp. TaxID=2953763 RepID=UPI002897B23A|nr:phosphoglucomutase/phosphomannomutase family protein [Hydrogenoanaerobacterium sp.]
MIKFGTGGWRAIIGDGFTKANVQLLTRALARMMKDSGSAENGFCIGYDRRFLSVEAAKWAAEVIAGEGICCKILDREAPTPLIMFTVKEMNMDYGMAITASHNPAIYNGIKVFTAGGRDADERVTAEIEMYIADLCGEPVALMDYEKGIACGLIEEIDSFNNYIDSILSAINTEAIKQRRLKVALDPMYGVSQTSLRTILLTARCDVEVIHERHDTLFGGRLPAPNEDTMKSLVSYVLDHHCDLGVATDGDADRIGVIDDHGDFLHPNRILTLLYYYLVKYKGWHGPVVRNNSTTHLLDKVAESFGEKCYEVPVGFKHVSAKMRESNAVIGGESSGGLTVRGHIQGKDGIYAAALLVEMIAVTGKRLSELYQEILDTYGILYTKELDFRMTPERKHELTELLFTDKLLPEFTLPIEHVSYLDGCKIYFKNGGWIIARFSGTEPLLRVCCEMPQETLAEQTAQTLQTFLKL